MKRKAFTLVELLVSVAIVMFIVSMLMPTLRQARAATEVAVCMKDQRQIAQGWNVYAMDNGRKIIWSDPAGDPDGNMSPDRWVKRGNTTDAIKEGALWPYLQDLNVYHCPSDWTDHPRTYSMAGFLHGENNWGQMPWPTYAQTLGGVQYPSQQLLLVEENDPRGWNIGSWVIYPNEHPTNSSQWVDYVGVFHQGGDNVGFADGHVEFWEYQDERTLEFADGGFHFYSNHPNSPDLQRYQSHYNPGSP